MSPYREPSPRLQHWDDPQAGDLVRLVEGGAIADVLEVGCRGGLLLFFDWFTDSYMKDEVVVIRRTDPSGRSTHE